MSGLALLSDLLLLAATIGLAGFCVMLSRREPVPPADDAGLAGRIEAVEAGLAELRETASASAPAAVLDAAAVGRLRDTIAAADDRIGQLELLLAGLEDVEPDVYAPPEPMPADDPIPIFRPVRPAQDRSLPQ
jgi:hypothetical protein